MSRKLSSVMLPFTQRLRIASRPCFTAMSGAWPSYTDRLLLLPQSQSPAQLSAWLSASHPDYDMTSWCLFGNLIGDDGDDGPGRVDAVSAVVQLLRQPLVPSCPNLFPCLRLRTFEAGFTYDGAGSDGYRIFGTMGLMPSPTLAITPEPWSVVVRWQQNGASRSVLCLSLVEGEMGRRAAVYMLTADVHDVSGRRVQAEIRLRDRLGIVNEGYGPASFLPQWLTPEQNIAIQQHCNHSVAGYLAQSGDAMACQGAYYYSAPLLDVVDFTLRDQDGRVHAHGRRGSLWLDFVVQSFNAAAWQTVSGAAWTFFAIQFPEHDSALMISTVRTTSPPSTLPTAKYFTASGERTANAALNAVHEWSMDQIAIHADPRSLWTSPISGARYHLTYDIRLGGTDFPVELRLQAVRPNQEIYVLGNSKYEGVFTVKGHVNAHGYHGLAWGELHKA